MRKVTLSDVYFTQEILEETLHPLLYFQPLMALAPFCKQNLHVVLRGVTNNREDPSPDLLKVRRQKGPVTQLHVRQLPWKETGYRCNRAQCEYLSGFLHFDSPNKLCNRSQIAGRSRPLLKNIFVKFENSFIMMEHLNIPMPDPIDIAGKSDQIW